MISTNKYGSLLNTFTCDILSIAFPVTPPANLTQAQITFAKSYLSFRSGINRVVAFNKLDMPYIRGIGIFSNLADGLVNASTYNSNFNVANWTIQFVPYRFGAKLTGTITIASASATVTGTGTMFTRELIGGGVQTISFQDANGVFRTGIVQTITNDTSLTLSVGIASGGMFAGAVTGVAAYPYVGGGVGGSIGYAGGSISYPFVALNNVEDFSAPIITPGIIYPPQGKISTTVGSNIVTGLGTSFLTDFASGGFLAYIDDAGQRNSYAISSVNSNTQMILSANVAAPASVNALPAGSGTATMASPQIVPTYVANGTTQLDDHVRIECSFVGTSFNAYTIAIDPSFVGKNWVVSPMVTLEQTFAMNSVAA